MPFIGSTTSYPVVTPDADDRLPLVQSGALRQALPGGVAARGGLPGLRYVIDASDTTDSDPGPGKLKFNDATQPDATEIYADDETQDGVSMATFYAAIGSGFLLLIQVDDPTRWNLFAFSAVVDGTGYRKFTVVSQAAGAAFDNDAVVVVLPIILGGSVAAADVSIVDAGGYYTGTDVEDALQEVGAALGGFTAAQYPVDGSPPTDDTWQGRAITGVNAGATIAQWEAVYLGSGGEWLLADANGSGTFPCRGLAAEAGTDNNPMSVVTEGVIRNDAWNWTTIGGAIYLSNTAGGLTQTPPSASGEIVQPVGFALSADSIYLNIGAATYIEVA
jgi:hypothetical protein